MKIPKLAYVQPPSRGGQFYATVSLDNPALAGIQMNNIFGDIFGGIKDIVAGGIGKIPCILSKAGPKGISCFTQCGPNPGCLAACAGPSVVSAIMDCL